MDEYEMALGLFLYHYYQDLASAAYSGRPATWSHLTKVAARLVSALIPRDLRSPDQVSHVMTTLPMEG